MSTTGKTYDIADNLVKMACSLKYDDFDAKDKIIQYAGKLITDEFGSTSIFMQKLGLIVFSPKDKAVLGGMGAGEDQIKRSVFESGAEKLIELLEEVRDKLGGPSGGTGRVIIIQAKDRVTASRIKSHIRAKGLEPLVIKDSDDWQGMLDDIL